MGERGIHRAISKGTPMKRNLLSALLLAAAIPLSASAAAIPQAKATTHAKRNTTVAQPNTKEVNHGKKGKKVKQGRESDSSQAAVKPYISVFPPSLLRV